MFFLRIVFVSFKLFLKFPEILIIRYKVNTMPMISKTVFTNFVLELSKYIQICSTYRTQRLKNKKHLIASIKGIISEIIPHPLIRSDTINLIYYLDDPYFFDLCSFYLNSDKRTIFTPYSDATHKN